MIEAKFCKNHAFFNTPFSTRLYSTEPIEWFYSHQKKDGMWNIENNPNRKTIENKKIPEKRRWLTINICRLLKNF